jgi:hypothetical protein
MEDEGKKKRKGEKYKHVGGEGLARSADSRPQTCGIFFNRSGLQWPASTDRIGPRVAE